MARLLKAMRGRCLAAVLAVGAVAACSPPAGNVGSQLQGGPARARELILVGEIHGTEETPAEFGNIVERLARRDHPVNVGLELPQTALDVPCGGPVPEDSYWKRPMQDGRTSGAMIRLVCRLRDFQRRGLVRLFGIVPETPPQDDGHPYYAAIRRNLAGHAEKTLILLGNFHSRRVPGGLPQMLEADGASVTALTVSSPTISAWNCRGAARCGTGGMTATFCAVEAERPTIVLGERAGMGPSAQWDGCLVFPSLSASPPA